MRTGKDLLTLMYQGDPRCEIPVGAHVKKVQGEENDNHLIGTQGIVKGSIMVDSSIGPREGYLVKFGDDTTLTFIIGHKIRKL